MKHRNTRIPKSLQYHPYMWRTWIEQNTCSTLLILPHIQNNTSKVVRIPFSHMVLSTLLQSNQVFAIKYGTLLCHVVSWEDQTKIKLISEMTMPITTKLVIEKLKWHNQLLAYPTHVYYTKAPRKKRCFDGLHSNYQRCYCVLFL